MLDGTASFACMRILKSRKIRPPTTAASVGLTCLFAPLVVDLATRGMSTMVFPRREKALGRSTNEAKSIRMLSCPTVDTGLM